MMAGFQAEENLTGRPPKKVRKTLDVIQLLHLDWKITFIYSVSSSD